MSNQPDTASIRERLARTGRLVSRAGDDASHLSQAWRETIEALCDALDIATGLTIVTPRDRTEALISSVRDVIAPELEEKFARATFLIEEAMPRMRTLNNAMSPRWVAMATEFLKGNPNP